MDVRSDCEADSIIPSPLKPEQDSGTQEEVVEASTRCGSDGKVAALDTKLKRNIASRLKAKSRGAAKDGIATREAVSSDDFTKRPDDFMTIECVRLRVADSSGISCG